MAVIDEIEVVGFGDEARLDDPGAFVISRYAWQVAWRHAPSPAVRDEVLALWDAVPDGEPMRCHLPVMGLRLLSGGAEVARIAPCFGCNNASIWTLDGESWRNFDARSSEGKALLALLLDLAPPDWRASLRGT